jgi:hypothetical protein
MTKKLRIKKETNSPKTPENPVSSPRFDTLYQRIIDEFGKGYSLSHLRNMRRFYLVYQNQIRQTVSGELVFQPTLSWSI